MKKLLLALLFLFAPVVAGAATAVVYVDTGGCNTGSATQCSGTTDSATASASGAAATITCSGVAGPAGAQGCSITGSAGQLSGIAVDGSQALFVNCATNTTQKIFFINAVDDVGGLVGTSGNAPTGCTAASSDWGIGGRYIWPSGAGVNSIESALRAGDILQFNNTPATKTVTYITARTSGDSTTGPITIRGKSGVQPLLNITNTTVVITLTGQTNWTVSNLALKQDGASGNVVTASGAGLVFDQLKITGGGTAGSGISNNSAMSVLRSEITNCGTAAITSGGGSVLVIFGNYIHDNQGDGLTNSATLPAIAVINNIFDTNAGKGVYISGAATTQAQVSHISGNVFYANGNGLQVDDADIVVVLTNNIFSSNTSKNANWAAGSAELHGFHGYNTFFNGSNTGLTTNSTEITGDPLMVAPATGNFAISSGSPAKATGYPGVFAGGLSTGYQDMGAVQIQALTNSGNRLTPGVGQ